jgi:hypothetical protein
MIKFITWEQYLLSAGGALLLYYIIILLLYFRREIEAVFKPRPMLQIIPAAAQRGDFTQLMGEPEFDGQRTEDAENLIFAAEEQEPETLSTTQKPDESFLLGPVADFLKELKSSMSLLKEAQGDKEEMITLLHILSAKYTTVMQSNYRPLLEIFILEMAAEQLPFALTAEDLQNILNRAI